MMYLSTLLRIFPETFFENYQSLIPKNYKPIAGDLVKVKVIEINSTKLNRLELYNNDVVELKQDDTFIGVFGSRSAVDYLTGHPPSSLNNENLYTLNIGGVIGEITQATVGADSPPKIIIEGIICQEGKVLNTIEFFRQQEFNYNENQEKPKAIIFVGDGRSTGKTSSLAKFGEVLSSKSMSFGTMKLTGIARKRDSIQHASSTHAGVSIDFIDCGLPSSIIDPDIYTESINNLLTKFMGLEKTWLIELGAGLMSEYNVETAIAILNKRLNVVGYVMCAKTRMAAYGCFIYLRGLVGQQLLALSGPVTNSGSGINSVSKYSDIPMMNIYWDLKKIEEKLQPFFNYGS